MLSDLNRGLEGASKPLQLLLPWEGATKGIIQKVDTHWTCWWPWILNFSGFRTVTNRLLLFINWPCPKYFVTAAWMDWNSFQVWMLNNTLTFLSSNLMSIKLYPAVNNKFRQSCFLSRLLGIPLSCPQKTNFKFLYLICKSSSFILTPILYWFYELQISFLNLWYFHLAYWCLLTCRQIELKLKYLLLCGR